MQGIFTLNTLKYFIGSCLRPSVSLQTLCNASKGSMLLFAQSFYIFILLIILYKGWPSLVVMTICWQCLYCMKAMTRVYNKVRNCVHVLRFEVFQWLITGQFHPYYSQLPNWHWGIHIINGSAVTLTDIYNWIAWIQQQLLISTQQHKTICIFHGISSTLYEPKRVIPTGPLIPSTDIHWDNVYRMAYQVNGCGCLEYILWGCLKDNRNNVR